MNPLQAIPTKVRSRLYLAYALAGLALGACPIVGVDDLWGLPVVKAGALLAYLGVGFGFTAAANTNSGVHDEEVDVELYDDPEDDEEERHDEDDPDGTGVPLADLPDDSHIA